MDLPPPVMKQQVRNLSAQQDIKFLKGGLSGEAVGARLPMLQALRDFMEDEQRKTRRKLGLLVTVFSAAVVVALLVSLGAAWFFAQQGKSQLADVQAGLADVRKENQALKASVESRLNSWQAEAAAQQEAVAGLETALAGVKAQMTSALADLSDAPAKVSPLVAVVQEIQLVRTEKVELELRQAALQREGEQLAEARARRDERRTKLANDQQQLAEAVKSFAARYQEAQARLQKIGQGAAPAAGVDPNAVVGRTRRDAQLLAQQSGPSAVALEELYRLRAEQLDLQARQTDLQKELDDLEADQRWGDLRLQRLEEQRAALATEVESFLARQRALRERLESLQGTATPGG